MQRAVLGGLLLAASLFFAGCASHAPSSRTPAPAPAPGGSPFLFTSSANGTLGWIFHVKGGNGQFDCNVTLSAQGNALPGAPVAGIASWASSDDPTSQAGVGGLDARIWRSSGSPMVAASAEAMTVTPVPGSGPAFWTLDGKDVLGFSGREEDIAIQFQGLVATNGTPSASVRFACSDALLEGPWPVQALGMFEASTAQHGASVDVRGPPGSGDLRILDENGQRSVSWSANASLVLGQVTDGHGSGVKHVSITTSDGRKDWLMYENQDMLGAGDAAFFALDWAQGSHTLALDAVGVVALASETDILFFDANHVCPTNNGCGILVPAAAQPTA